MEFDLYGFGRIQIDESELMLECDKDFPLKELYKRFPERAENLSDSAKQALKKAVKNGQQIPIDDLLKMEITVFLMSANMELSKEELKTMRTCGAAKFIPSQLKKEGTN